MALLGGSDSHQLDRLGRELKCPICLSLFKEAASLTCNHTFCRSCITQSMKNNSACPICKVHITRREVRAAPQMDSLVSIFVSMGGAAGLDIMASQNVTTINEAVEAQNGEAGTSKSRNALSNITNCEGPRQKSTGKGKSSDCTFKGPIPAKKRVQVPKPSSLKGELEAHGEYSNDSPLSSAEKGVQNVLVSGGSRPNKGRKHIKRKGSPTETEATKPYSARSRKKAKVTNGQNLASEQSSPKQDVTEASGKEELVQMCRKGNLNSSGTKRTKKRKGKDVAPLPGSQPSSQHDEKSNEMPGRDECSRRKLDPFFWLRDESSQDTEALQITQLTLTQSTARPNFSDLKDSDDDHAGDANEEMSNHIAVCGPGSYDSDDFDWTQLPCSPEIRCSPSKNQSTEDDLVVDLPLEVPKLLATEGLPSNDQDLHRDTSQEIILTECLLVESASKVAKIAQDNLDNFLKENKKSRKTRRKQSGLPKSANPVADVIASQNKNSVEKHILLESSGHIETTGNQSMSSIPLREEALQFNLKVRSNKKLEKLKKPHKSKMESNKPDAAKANNNAIGELDKAGNNPKPRITVCVFCGSSKCSQITGPMMHYDQEGTPLDQPECNAKVVHVHKHCAEWAPDVYFVEDQAKNLKAEALRGLKIKCCRCGKRGAALGCCVKRCRKSYHYPCARALSCRWEEEQFIMLCPEHKSENFPTKKRCQSRLNRAVYKPRTVLKPEVPENTNSHEEILSKWACGQSSKWVLCGSALDSNGKDQLVTFAKITGATVSKAWSSNVTHVIAGVDQHGAARRTMKYLMAILEGKWILKLEWLAACIKAGKPVSEELHEIGIDIHGVVGGPKQGRLLAAHKASKLLCKMQFYFMPDFSTSYKGDLQALVMAGGGVVLHRKPVFLETDAGQETTIVVYNNENPNSGKKVDDGKVMSKRQEEAQSLAMSVGAWAVPHQWILDSIASSKVMPLE